MVPEKDIKRMQQKLENTENTRINPTFFLLKKQHFILQHYIEIQGSDYI